MTFAKSLTALALLAAAPAFAQDACSEITFSDVGWTDITATTAATTFVLDALGYQTEILVLSVPVTYTSMAEGDVDVFLGNWMPTMEADIAPYREAGTVDTVGMNLEGAKYTLATNPAGAALGITSFDSIAANAEALDSQIYGIEPGNDGNRLILDMIESGAFGLEGFEDRRGCCGRGRDVCPADVREGDRVTIGQRRGGGKDRQRRKRITKGHLVVSHVVSFS